VVTDGLPARVSATAVQALRDCPYRFFARALLRLREDDELDAEPEKRDYGTWLHDVLLRFHRERPPQRRVEDDLAALHGLADAVRAEHGIDAAPWLPFRTAFDDLAPRYVAWVQQRDAAGWLWEAGELERERAPDALLPVRLFGRIDRIDRRHGAEGTIRQLIDYKTGSVGGLKAKVRQPLEDTQLAFYAALAGAADTGTPAEMQAMYLALDDRAAPVAVEHPDVADTVPAFLDGLAADLRDLRAGLGLAALGEGPVCEHCEVRGLCRRDHWALGADVAGPAGKGIE
jgi:ATP-dependent helicase/nuclease subunit B